MQVQNLVGGTGNDTFKFVGTAPSLSGTISGGLGKNSLDYSGFTAAATVNLQTLAATGLNSGASGGFSGIASLVGNPNASDTLIGPNTATAWAVTSLDAGKAGTFVFKGIANLVGGSGDDTFKISNGAGVGGSLNGGGGTNALDYSLWNTGLTVNLGSGAATAITGGVSNITILTGGSGSDVLTGGAGTDLIRGGSGTDSILGGSGADILIGGSGADLLSAGAGRSILIADHGPATLQGGAAGDILIGGYTSYDTNTAANNKALLALLGEWTSADSYTSRLAKIRAGLPGGYKFSSATVHDLAGDVLNGQANFPANPDWFWALTPSEIHDADGGTEQVN